MNDLLKQLAEIRKKHQANFDQEVSLLPSNVKINKKINVGVLTLWHNEKPIAVNGYSSRTKKIPIIKRWMKLYPNFNKATVTDSRQK